MVSRWLCFKRDDENGLFTSFQLIEYGTLAGGMDRVSEPLALQWKSEKRPHSRSCKQLKSFTSKETTVLLVLSNLDHQGSLRITPEKERKVGHSKKTLVRLSRWLLRSISLHAVWLLDMLEKFLCPQYNWRMKRQSGHALHQSPCSAFCSNVHSLEHRGIKFQKSCKVASQQCFQDLFASPFQWKNEISIYLDSFVYLRFWQLEEKKMKKDQKEETVSVVTTISSVKELNMSTRILFTLFAATTLFKVIECTSKRVSWRWWRQSCLQIEWPCLSKISFQ